MYAKNFSLAAAALGLGLVTGLAGTAGDANAAESNPQLSALSTVGAFICNVQPEFPAGLEELSSSDVKHSINRHLTKVGIADANIDVTVTNDETYYVQITHTGMPSVTELVVDPATAQIVDLSVYADLPNRLPAAQKSDQGLQKVGYQNRLRNHMLGDGKTWANWVGSVDSRIVCGDDYSQGGPDIKG